MSMVTSSLARFIKETRRRRVLGTVALYIVGAWTLGAGIRNVVDTVPPPVEIFELGGPVPKGYGYDMRGRTFFVNGVWRP